MSDSKHLLHSHCVQQPAGRSGSIGGASGGSAGASGGSAGASGGSAGASGGTGGKSGSAAGDASTSPVKRLGAVPDATDLRDYYYEPKVDFAHLPTSVDLRPLCPPIYDQGALESCTANAIAGAIQFNQMRARQTTFTPSRLFIFYNERVIGGNVDNPNGSSIRNGIKTAVKTGAPPETLWPYDEAAVCAQPVPEAYTAARFDHLSRYNRVAQHLDHIKACLFEGFPMVFCFQTYTSFTNICPTGVIPMPAPTDQEDGWHAMMVVGYDDASQTFVIRNSWGTRWGLEGYGTMPYAYLLNPKLISDLWTIRGVTETAAPIPPPSVAVV